jgi:multiple sugar transport system substrate-binding protein
MKRFLVSLLILSLSIVLLADVNLTMIQVFTSPSRTTVLENIISQFEKKHPGVHIDLISPPYETAYNKIYLMLSTNQPLDIVEVGDWSLSSVASMGKLANLEDYINSSSLKDYFVPGVMDCARTYKNTAYLLPNGIYVKTPYLRKDILESKGITKMPTTMDDFYNLCLSLTKPDANQYGFAFRGTGFPTSFIDLIVTSYFDDIDPKCMYLTKSGNIIWSDPRAGVGLQKYVDFYKNTSPKDSINWGFDEQVNSFISGITPVLIQDPDTTGMLNSSLGSEKYMTIPLPIGDKSGKSYPSMGFAGWGITSYSKNKDLAWKFIEFFNSPEINAYWCKDYGALPVDSRVYDIDDYFKSSTFKGWTEMFNDTKHYQFTKYPIDNEEWGDWNQVQQDTMQNVLLGKLSIKDALKQWTKFWKDAGL